MVYDLSVVFLISMVVAIVASLLRSSSSAVRGMVGCSCWVGVFYGTWDCFYALHTGMAAMQVTGAQYDPNLVALSITIGISASVIACGVPSKHRDNGERSSCGRSMRSSANIYSNGSG